VVRLQTYQSWEICVERFAMAPVVTWSTKDAFIALQTSVRGAQVLWLVSTGRELGRCDCTPRAKSEILRLPCCCCCCSGREVAYRLQQGKTVQPENFTAVTIFLCDIVGFTPLAAAMKPIEVCSNRIARHYC